MYLKAGDSCPPFFPNSLRPLGLDRALLGGSGDAGALSGESEGLNKRSKLQEENTMGSGEMRREWQGAQIKIRQKKVGFAPRMMEL